MVIIIKTIGIILRNFEENNKSFIGTRNDLFNVFKNYDVNVIGISINQDINKIINIVNVCDGIILSGGDNFVSNDFFLIDYLYKNDIPTLGICLGMQAMAKYFSSFDEVNVLNHLSNQQYVHYINILEDSLLYKILNKKRILVNSRHKSAIIETKLDVVARSDDDIIEAVEDNTKIFFLGLEWHPESINDENSKKIFEYFIDVINLKQ